MQAEKTNDFEQRKTTAGPLAATLGPLTLVGGGIWHRQASAIDNFDPAPQPELIVGHLAFELLGHLRANLLEHCLIESSAGLTVGAGISRCQYKYIYLCKDKLFLWKNSCFLPTKLRFSKNVSSAAKLSSSPSIG